MDVPGQPLTPVPVPALGAAQTQSLRGWNSSAGGRPTPSGPRLHPLEKRRLRLPRRRQLFPAPGRGSRCLAPPAAVPAAAAGPPVAPTVSAAAPAAPSFPHLFKYRLRSGFSREKYFFKKKKEKENDTPSYIPLITTPPLGPIHPSFPLPFASHRLGAGPPSLAGPAQGEEAEVLRSCPAGHFSLWGEELRGRAEVEERFRRLCGLAV